MREEQIQDDAVELIPPTEEGECGVEIKGGKFTWTPETNNGITLIGIDLDVKRGMRVAVCGTVGSGKSSLLSCILGEIHKLSGTVRIRGSKAYVAQSPWILTGSIRDNILFGKAYDGDRYWRTVEACALVKDFELFSCGDLTEIGERGINMSGGQKQRIQIARAIYQDADIYLLDDPFSAVDAHTGTHLFQECLMGILESKTVIYVTHQAEKLFSSMLKSVVGAPMHFFDSTPTGRILNRASRDQNALDLEMGQKLGSCAFSIIQMLGTIVVMSQVAWEVFVIFIPVTAICIWYQQIYTPTARELARLTGIQSAPILHHFSESLAGAATIRAFDQGERFIALNLGLINNHSRPWFHNMSAVEWLSFRLNLLSNFVFAFSLVLLVTLPDGIITPSIAGLAVTYGINLNVLQTWVIRNICSAENKMIAVERVLQYTKIKGEEAPVVTEQCRPPANWPEIGTIYFNDLQVRYAEHLPWVLKNVSCTFPGRRKVGVVGRTGSGKSTLTQALFRMVQVRAGSIIIDGIDISKIGLHDLRSRLSIIPQDPTMFQGTVRGNLDPLGHYSDLQIWEALEKCQLGSLVREKAGKLDATVTENGENWSAGQRQLFCLGRALLKKSSILVLDEATASVDSATDSVLQKIIGEEFEDRTVVTIAHIIQTVIDSDLVLVLSDGRVAEYDSPKMLLQRNDSFFSKLIKEYSARSSDLNSSSAS
ncbi:ABC transporter C family member 9 [Linum grandiflorum]